MAMGFNTLIMRYKLFFIFYFLFSIFYACKPQKDIKSVEEIESIKDFVLNDKIDVKNLVPHKFLTKEIQVGEYYKDKDSTGKIVNYRSIIIFPQEFLSIHKIYNDEGNLKETNHIYYPHFSKQIKASNWCHYKDFTLFDYNFNEGYNCDKVLTAKEVVKKSCDTLGIDYKNLIDFNNSKTDTLLYQDESTNNSWLQEIRYYKEQQLWQVIIFKNKSVDYETYNDLRCIVLNEETGKIIDIIKGRSAYNIFKEKYLQ